MMDYKVEAAKEEETKEEVKEEVKEDIKEGEETVTVCAVYHCILIFMFLCQSPSISVFLRIVCRYLDIFDFFSKSLFRVELHWLRHVFHACCYIPSVDNHRSCSATHQRIFEG